MVVDGWTDDVLLSRLLLSGVDIMKNIIEHFGWFFVGAAIIAAILISCDDTPQQCMTDTECERQHGAE